MSAESMPAGAPEKGRRIPGTEFEGTDLSPGDIRLALEIAEFVAERAQEFEDYECRAWAVTDFGVWAVLAGRSPRLSLEHEPLSFADDESAP